MKQPQLLFLLMLALANCTNKRTYLSEEIKSVNPYQQGQKLVFVSATSFTNNLLIDDIEDMRFSDALGAPTNERMTVSAWRLSRTIRDDTEEYILSFAATDEDQPEEITFELTLKDAGMNGYSIALSDFNNLEIKQLKTEYFEFDDVVVINLPYNERTWEAAFVQLSWSKSTGYVQMVQKDGTVWNLKEITNR